jgi:hypothetical protein
MKHTLAENMRRFHTKNLKEDAYTESQAETRLKQLIDRVFQAVNNSQPVKENGTAKLQSLEPGFYTIMLNKPGKFLKRARTGQLNVYLDQDPKHLVITVKINGEHESKEIFDWGDGLFASDDAAYDKVIDVAMHVAEFIMYSQN